jgi:hypothetical protein
VDGNGKRRLVEIETYRSPSLRRPGEQLVPEAVHCINDFALPA